MKHTTKDKRITEILVLFSMFFSKTKMFSFPFNWEESTTQPGGAENTQHCWLCQFSNVERGSEIRREENAKNKDLSSSSIWDLFWISSESEAASCFRQQWGGLNRKLALSTWHSALHRVHLHNHRPPHAPRASVKPGREPFFFLD